MHRATSLMIAAGVLALATTPGLADHLEEHANAEETAQVEEAIAAFGCSFDGSEVEKEGDNQFEIDDAVCGGNQYDIKLDGTFTVTTMTFDGPVDPEGEEVEATAEETAAVEEAIAAMNCRVGPSPIEKEGDNLFEIDDAECDAGQFDIKLDGDFTIINMTRDYD